MNRTELIKRIEALGIPPTLYSLEGKLIPTGIVLEYINSKWRVFLLDERGGFNKEQVFSIEENAYNYMYELLKGAGKFLGNSPENSADINQLELALGKVNDNPTDRDFFYKTLLASDVIVLRNSHTMKIIPTRPTLTDFMALDGNVPIFSSLDALAESNIDLIDLISQRMPFVELLEILTGTSIILNPFTKGSRLFLADDLKKKS